MPIFPRIAGCRDHRFVRRNGDSESTINHDDDKTDWQHAAQYHHPGAGRNGRESEAVEILQSTKARTPHSVWKKQLQMPDIDFTHKTLFCPYGMDVRA